MDQIDNSPRGVPSLQFDPDKHPHATLKAFNDFVEQYEFRYEAQYPEPPKNILESAILRWKSEHENTEPTTAEQIAVRDAVISLDKVRKLLGFLLRHGSNKIGRQQNRWLQIECVRGTNSYRKCVGITNPPKMLLSGTTSFDRCLNCQQKPLVRSATELRRKVKRAPSVIVQREQPARLPQQRYATK